MYLNWLTSLTLCIVSVLFVLYALLKWHYKYWAKKGVPYLKPNLIFGNAKDIFLANISLVDYHNELYKKFAPHKFGGYFRFQRPMLMIRDPQLAKQILVKDFTHFYDHSNNFLEDKNPLSFHLFNLTGEQWRQLRTKLTPTFTSGKMKLMFHLMKECAQLLDDIIRQAITQNSHQLEMKELMERYGTDVISTCAFGLQINSLEDSETEFRKMGCKVFEGSLKQKLFMILNFISPTFRKMLNLTTLENDVVQFFINLVSNTVTYRQANKLTRNDFLDLLIALKDEEKLAEGHGKSEFKIEMTMELMAAQCYLFFVAGFETSSGVLSNCLMELAKQPDIQEKLHQEINKVLIENDGNVTYDLLQMIPYLDKVVSETMRLYPSLSVLIRQCTKSYRIPETDVIIDKGTEVFIPVYGFHRDPKYYHNPDEFNPDNFSDENKLGRHNYTYLPFGEGPRMCIGLRFGLMQVKLGLITLLRQYRFEVSSKMTFPVQFKPGSPVTSIMGGIWLNCYQR